MFQQHEAGWHREINFVSDGIYRQGFLYGRFYAVSSMGVTWVRKEITTDIDSLIQEIRSVSDVPCAVGFGISTPETAAGMAAASDGAIVSSAIVRLIAAHGRMRVNLFRNL